MTGISDDGDAAATHGEATEQPPVGTAARFESLHLGETPPHVVLLMRPGRNRALLASLLSPPMDVMETTEVDDLSDDVDLCIVDRAHLARHRDALADRRVAVDPLFFPILLIDPGDAASKAKTWTVVDEVVQVPISKTVFRARLRNLLSRRQQSQRVRDKQRELETALAQLRVRERAIAAAPIGVSIGDATADDIPLMYVNDGFCALTGYSREEALGRNCRFLQGTHTDRETVAEIRAAIDAGEPLSVDIVNYTREGERFWNKLDLAPVRDDEGAVTHFIGFQTDITERKLHEQRVNVLNRVLRHNLRNELNVIDGYAETLDTEESPPVDALDHIQEAASRLASLSDEVAHIEHLFGARRPESEDQSVAAFLERIRRGVTERHPGVRVDVECPDGTVCINVGMLAVGCIDYLSMLLRDADSLDGSVTVSATLIDEDTVDICLRADGPGLSAADWNVIETGYETPLRHADELGLWVLRWVTTTVGGELLHDEASNTLHVQCPVRSRGASTEATEETKGGETGGDTDDIDTDDTDDMDDADAAET